MPTTRPRHQVTETPAVARALDLAARRWPGEPRSRLLVRLLESGSAVLAAEEDAEIARRRTAIQATSGRYDAMFGDDHLTDLRADWPE